MKFILSFILLLSTNANAGARPEIPSSSEEVKILCDAVTASLEEQAADIALDEKKCLASTVATTTILDDGSLMIMSDLKFNDVYRSGFVLTYTTYVTSKGEVIPDSTVCQY